MADIKVAFPEPCSESWDGMALRGCDRHCAACDTLVHDLSAMTVEEVESLLDSGERICVRVEVDRRGRVKTGDVARRDARRILACAGAMLAAACQTTPGGHFENGYTLSGRVLATSFSGGSRIRDSQGDSAKLLIGKDGRFDVHGLSPGSYTLDVLDYCGERHEFTDIAITDTDVDLGRLEIETSCVIVGLIVRNDEIGRG